MNSDPNCKLSDEALTDLLAQTSNTDSTNSEVLALKSAIGSYRVETLAWAERRSATQPSLAAKAKADRWAAVPQWSLAAVAVVAVAAGVVHYTGYGVDNSTTVVDVGLSIPAIPAATTPEDIAADNVLLGSIDKALQYNSVSPATEFQAAGKPSGRSTHIGVTD